MRVVEWDNSLAVRLPAAVVEALELKEGDDIEIYVVDNREFAVSRKPGRKKQLKRLHTFCRASPPPSSSTLKRRMPGNFFDTNVLLYPHPAIRPRRTRREQLVGNRGTTSIHSVISVTI